MSIGGFEMQEFKKDVKTEKYLLHILYKGEPKEEDIDSEKLYMLMDSIFATREYDLNIVQIIYTIRRILKQYDENYLLVELQDFKYNQYSKVLVENKKVTTYIKNGPIFLYKIGSVMAELKCSNEGLDIHIPNAYDSMANLFRDTVTMHNYMDSVFENINHINEMKDINGLYLNNGEKRLIDFYRWFFGEYPDFRSEVTIYRMHQMVYLLKIHGIDVIENISDFQILGLDGPHSNTLQKKLDCLVPFETAESYGGSRPCYHQDIADKILALGKIIRSFSEVSDQDMDGILLHICNILFIMKSDFPNKSIEFIISSDYVNCDREIVEEILGLLDVIGEYMCGKLDSKKEYELPYPFFNIETDWKTVVMGGFVEEYCLSEGEQKQLKYLRKKYNNN